MLTGDAGTTREFLAGMKNASEFFFPFGPPGETESKRSTEKNRAGAISWDNRTDARKITPGQIQNKDKNDPSSNTVNRNDSGKNE